MADNKAFTFPDFNFSKPHSLPFNGVHQDDNEWGDFFVAASQPSFSNSNFDPFSSGSDPSLIRVDPGPITFQKPRGAMPLSFFDEPDPNCPAPNGKIEVNLGSNGDAFGGWDTQRQKINPDVGLDLNSGVSVSDLNDIDDGDGDEWEFTSAFSTNNGHVIGNEKELGASLSSKVEPAVVRSQEKQAGQDVSSSAVHKHGSNNSMPNFVDLFSTYHGTFHKPSETNAGLINSCITPNANGSRSMPNLFHGVEVGVNGTGTSVTSVDEDDDFDDFGNFIDASQEVGAQKQQGQCIPDNSEAQLPNGNIHEGHQIQRENSRGPLPMSLFSDGLDEPNDDLTHQDEMFDKPISNPRNGVSVGISINDLLSNLYSQAQQTPSLGSNTKPAENGVHSPQNPEDSTPCVGDDDWDDDSWEFKDALSETGMNEQSFSDTASNLQFYMDFYAKLRGSLCVLLSHELNEEKKSQSSNTGNDEKVEYLRLDIQEAYKLLEGNMITEENHLKKHLDKNCCLSEVFEDLQEPKCKIVESEYSVSERLQLAMNDWRIAADLLKHAISVLQILSLGSADEQSVYVSIWSKILSVCVQELKHGAFIWSRALETNVQAQILSDIRGQLYIQALGEIYKIVELLRLSTELYKPWMFFSVSEQQPFSLLKECVSLWSSSGLEEALQNVSDNVRLGNKEAARTLMISIKNIHDVDVLAMHDSVFVQRRSICQLSLLPQGVLSDWKVTEWNKVPCFVNLANLWANLISPHPPQLPLLQVT